MQPGQRTKHLRIGLRVGDCPTSFILSNKFHKEIQMKIRSELKAGAACYTVQKGDNLAYIARDFYGSMTKSNVDKIYQANRKTIGANPNVIYPGQKLFIPD
jgi:LysM repeat protein